MFSTTARFARVHLEFCIPWDQTVIFAVSMSYVALTLCFKLRSFYVDFCCFLSISNITVMNLRFLYFSVCSTVSAIFFQNLVAMATLF